MKTTAQQFRKNPHKTLTLLGMSGIGKTIFAAKFSNKTWFHYSGDYRIGTQYLSEPILDEIKQLAMQVDSLRELLLSDSIYIRNNITIDHLHPLANFLGKIGNPELGGLSVTEFKRRQQLYRHAEMLAMQDVAEFMRKARQIYRYPHFINDAGGSIYCLDARECWDSLAESTLILYLRASQKMEQTLVERACENPKPLYYEADFLDRHLADFMAQHALTAAEQIVPDEFVQWIFPTLVSHRRPQYARVAAKYGYVIEAEQIFAVRDEQDIIDLICDSIDG